jgi:hypothetical protein
MESKASALGAFAKAKALALQFITPIYHPNQKVSILGAFNFPAK